MVDGKRQLKVFLCHAHADRDAVKALYTRLTQDGVDAWLDKEKLLPGQDWELEIRKAVREADVVVVCLSKQFNQKGFRQKEVRLALNTALEQPEGEIFIIPARLEECDNLESLRKWHEVDLFNEDGYGMLMRALNERANKIVVPIAKEEQRLKIFVTGGRDVIKAVEDLAFKIGYEVVKQGCILLNNGTRGVDVAAAKGAQAACEEEEYSLEEYIKVYRPKEGPLTNIPFVEPHIPDKIEKYEQRTKYVIKESNAVIILAGNRKTRDAIEWTRNAGKLLVPIGVGDSTYAAVELWQTMMKNARRGIKEPPFGEGQLKLLGDPTNSNDIAKNAVFLVKSQFSRSTK